ncbi:MAG: VWA domain-containing protein [Bacteroidota bacterium]|jgi:hypothetical protein|nr:VWA domain-containing protein [Bacteroidota bacterium]
MTRSILLLVFPALFFFFSSHPGSLSAQQLEASFGDVDYSQLPRVTFKACVREDQLIVRGLDPSRITLLENGVPMQVSLRCPGVVERNAVVLVLDNSGSMLGAMPKLIEASKRLVDSLGTMDECALITFGRGINVVQDFTTDKALLKSVLDNMLPIGGTPLFDASYEACGLLQSRAGNKHAVILTDGDDNQSAHIDQDVIDVANMIGAKLHTISFAVSSSIQEIMQRIAVETGGVFFVVTRPSDLPAIYAKIADIITEPCCVGEFISTNCVDTLRSLVMTVAHNARTAIATTTVVSPSRASRTRLVVDVPEDMTPLATDRGFIEMIPAPSMDLELTLSFVLEYDQNLVDIPSLPFTLNTVAQNQVVEQVNVAPGATRFMFRGIRPALRSTRLVGFSIVALTADSSRYVDFRIRDIQIEGCPTDFDVTGDSTLICQCYRALAIGMDSAVVRAATDPVLLPLRVTGGIETGMPLHLSARLALTSELDDVEVLPGTLLPDDALQWKREDGQLLLFTTTSVLPRDTSGLLATIRIGPNVSPDIRRIRVDLLASELWQRCCPLAASALPTYVLQEGRCDFILRRRPQPVRVENAPNPFSVSDGSRTLIVVDVPQGSAEQAFTLDVLDAGGRLIRRLHDGVLGEGVLRLTFDAAGLPSGAYHAVLRNDAHVVTRSMLYLR